MKGINLFFHSIKQGLANLRKNRMFTLASMGTIAACLFVFGLFYFVLSNFQNILHSAEQSVGISVFFEENLSEKQIADIGQKIEKRDEVERIEFLLHRHGKTLNRKTFLRHRNWQKALGMIIR